MSTASPPTQIASFDVFDTVLTRRVGDPRALFLLLGRRLRNKGLIECSAHAFSTARTQAEIRSFKNKGGLDSSVSLVDIYRDLASALHVSAGAIDKLVEEELELETEMLVPVGSGLDLVTAARARGERIVYVSDMYVSSDFLTEQLVRHGLFEDGDCLYISNEYARSKAGGGLWQIVIDDLGVDPRSIHHTGNDRRSDLKSARRAGLQATLVDENNLNRYEVALEQHSFATDGLTSALAGASRLARLDEDTLSPERLALRTVAAGVMAPFVVGKVLWVLERAVAEGLEAIYFVARDGQLLAEVATELAKKVGYHGELHYLYGSRQAWSLPSMAGGCDGVVETLCPDDGDVDATLRMVLHRFSIEPEDVADVLAQAGLTGESYDQLIDVERRRQLRSMLSKSGELAEAVSERAEAACDLMIRFLDQEGMLADRPTGFVDLGTGATLYNALSSVLATVGVRPPLSFYFGLRDDVTDKGFGHPLAYIRNEAEGIGYVKTPGFLTLVEMVCTADHASVTGYEENSDGLVEPTFGQGSNQPVVDWGLSVVGETIRRVAEELLLDPELVSCRQVDLRPAMLEVFDLFWNNPTSCEAASWGAYPFEDGWGDDAVRYPIAEKQGPKSALQRRPHRHWWEAGSRQLSGPVSRTLIRSKTESISTLRALKRRMA